MTSPNPGEYDIGPAVEWFRKNKDRLGPGSLTTSGQYDEAVRWNQMFWALAAIEALHREANTEAACTYLEHAAGIPEQFAGQRELA